MFLPDMAQSIGKQAARRRSECRSVVAPTGGWDTNENIADMDEDHALVMDNWFPDNSRITTRRGYASFSTGMSGDVQSLMAYEPDSGTRKLFAANAGNLYSVDAGGAVGAAAATGFSNDKWEYVNIGTAGGRFLFACNGADTAQLYNGTAFSDTTLTGPDTAKLAWCNMHQRRMWTGEISSLSAWYGGTNAITGAFTEFPMYGIATKGGYIMGMATWTRDSGQGQDDVAVFVTSEGEAIVYNGTDPSSVDTWSLVGVFQIGKPIGRRFFTKAGGDLILITQDGFVSAAGILVTDRTQAQKVAISDQINKAVNDAVRDAAANFGWQPVLYPRGKMLLVNIPITPDSSHQYVFNTLTKAPARFTGMDANCFCVFNDELYFGGKNGVVYKADNGDMDDGGPIYCDVLPAFSYLGKPGLVKKFNMAEAIFQADTLVSAAGIGAPALRLNTDFDSTSIPTAPTSISGGDSAQWDVAEWDSAVWGGDQNIFRSWQSVNGIGRSASLRTLIQNTTGQISLLAFNYIYEEGGFLR